MAESIGDAAADGESEGVMGWHFSPEYERELLAMATGAAVAPIALTVDEKQFQSAVIALAKRNGWKYFHCFDSRKSVKGWPDLFMVRAERKLAAELKDEDGVVTADQANWLEWLAAAGIPVFVWRPRDWNEIEDMLR